VKGIVNKLIMGCMTGNRKQGLRYNHCKFVSIAHSFRLNVLSIYTFEEIAKLFY